MFSGYYKLEDKTRESFRGEYFTAGDMARQDEDGYFYLVDRKKNMIITGGENVYPSEVETIIVKHEAVFDAAVEKAYGGSRRVAWTEVLAGQKAFDQTGQWLPDETVDMFRSHLIGIKGPLTTPVGGGIRSLNVALRQILDLYVCLRPVRWYRPHSASPRQCGHCRAGSPLRTCKRPCSGWHRIRGPRSPRRV